MRDDFKIGDYAQRLIRRNAKHLVRKAGFPLADIDYLEQTLLIDVWRRKDGFDPRKSKWETFVTMLVKNKVASILEHRHAAKRDPSREAYSLNEAVSDAGDDAIEKGDTTERDRRCPKRSEQEMRDLRLDVANVARHLPPKQRALVEALLDEEPITDITRRTGIPRASLYDAIRKLRAPFEDADLRDYL